MEKSELTTFPQFFSLPLDLRRIVYSKLLLQERISLVRTSKEASYYFNEKRNRWNVGSVIMYVSEISGSASLTVKYGNEHIEQYILPKGIDMSKELDSYKECSCLWCQNWEDFVHGRLGFTFDYIDLFKKDVENISRRVSQWKNMDDVLFPFAFVESHTRLIIRTVPYSGLMETISPSYPMPPPFFMGIFWHAKESEPAQSLNIPMWNKWLGHQESSNSVITFDEHNRTILVFVTSGHAGTVSEDVFTLEAAKHAGELEVRGNASIREDQLLSLRNNRIFIRGLSDKPPYFRPFVSSKGNPIQFLRNKIKMWIDHPSVQVFYGVPVWKFCAEQTNSVVFVSGKLLVTSGLSDYPPLLS